MLCIECLANCHIDMPCVRPHLTQMSPAVVPCVCPVCLVQVEDALYSLVEPTPTGTEPYLVAYSKDTAALLDLEPSECERCAWTGGYSFYILFFFEGQQTRGGAGMLRGREPGWQVDRQSSLSADRAVEADSHAGYKAYPTWGHPVHVHVCV